MTTTTAPSAPPLTQVQISGLALLKIIQHGGRTEHCAGCLLGVEDGQGLLQVTDAFPFPEFTPTTGGGGGAGMDDDEERPGGGLEEDASVFQGEMMRLLGDVNADDNCAGWYRSIHSGDWCTDHLIEQQFERQEDLDAGTGARSVLIVYDPFQSNNGHISLKALRLNDTFMEVMRAKMNSDLSQMAIAATAVSHFRMNDIFTEIPVVIVNPPMISRFVRDLSVRKDIMPTTLEPDFERLILLTNPYLEENVELVTDAIQSLQVIQANAQHFHRNLIKQKQQQAKFVAQRKAENITLLEKGLDPLPLRDANHPAFRPLKDTTRFESLFVRKQMDVFCEQINAWAAQNIEKLYLVMSVVMNKVHGGTAQQ